MKEQYKGVFTIKDAEAMEQIFMDNPRKRIMQLLEDSDNHDKKFAYLVKKDDPEKLRLLLDIHKEYAKLIGNIGISNIDFTIIRNRINDISGMQKAEECTETVSQYLTSQGNNIPIKLARAYASSCEIFWKKMKKLLLVTGIIDGSKHINITKLYKGMEELEKRYSVSLPKIKSFIKSSLRNSIDHEDIHFEPPHLVFLDNKGKIPVEVARLTVPKVYEMLLEQWIITSAILMVENTAIMSRIKPLLLLTDSEIDEFLKTGKLSDSAKLKFEKATKLLTADK